MARDVDDSEMAVAIGSRLGAIRTALGLTQQEFADRLGVPQPSYNHWETGRRMLPAKWAVIICDDFGVTMDWLYRADASGLPYRLHDDVLQAIRNNKKTTHN